MTDENQQVVGEETLDTTTMEVKEIPLIPAGKYSATFKGASVHCGKEWNSVPNVSVQHKLGEDGGNRVVFGQLLMSLNPDKNGQMHYQRKNGLKAFMKALGTDIEKLRVIKKIAINPENNAEVELKYLDATQIVEAIEQFKGNAYSVRVTIKAANGSYPAKNDVFEYFPSEQ